MRKLGEQRDHISSAGGSITGKKGKKIVPDEGERELHRTNF